MDPILNTLETALDGAAKRQQIIANNIANVNTPHYKRQDVDFTETLRRKLDKKEELKLETTTENHISGEQDSGHTDFRIETVSTNNYRNDKNNVDIDVEMAELAKNNIYYNTITQQLSNKFEMLKNVISKGGE